MTSVDLTSTRLIHRAPKVRNWTDSACVYEYVSPIGPLALREIVKDFAYAKSLGAQGVLLRPGLVDFTRYAPLLAQAIEVAHSLDLRFILRLSGQDIYSPHGLTGAFSQLEGPGIQLEQRGRIGIELGVDALDLGVFMDRPGLLGDRERTHFHQVVRNLRSLAAQCDREVPIMAQVAQAAPVSIFDQGVESGVEVLADDRLINSPFQAEEFISRITSSYRERDPLGLTTSWRVPGIGAGFAPKPQEKTASPDIRRQRDLAISMLAMSLPGMMYLRQGDEIALDLTERTNPLAIAEIIRQATGQGPQQNSEAAELQNHTRALLSYRANLGLAHSHLSLVTSAGFPPGVVFLLVGSTAIFMNTNEHASPLPEFVSSFACSHPEHSRISTHEITGQAVVWAQLKEHAPAERLARYTPRVG